MTNSEKQAKKQLQNMVKNGWILHSIRTEEEFLTDGEDYIYLGTGDTEDWADFNGERGTADMYDREKWSKKRGKYAYNADSVEIVEHDYPDESGGYVHELVLMQKNKLVGNPVDEAPGWEDDFMLEQNSEGYYWRYKNTY